MNNRVLDIIIDFIKGSKDKNLRIVNEENDKYYAICNSYYLLGQIIRSYYIECNHYYISKKSIELWKQISDEPIFKYWYRDSVIMEKDDSLSIHEYTGNSKKFKERTIKKGDVFHDEHIVPIKMIVDELLNLENPNYDSVIKILDKIYICRILKDEDRSIATKYNRSTDFNKVIQNEYKNIELIKLEDWKQIF